MSEDEIRAKAVQAVWEHFEVSEKTRVRTSIRNAAAICITIIGATWVSSWVVSTYLNDIRSGQERIEQSLNHKISVEDFAVWANHLDRLNRKTVPELIVPEPPSTVGR